MAFRCYPNDADPASYRGLPSLFGFFNHDGDLERFNCGQAAASTFLHHHEGGADPDTENAAAFLRVIEEMHPPNIAFGWLGTSRKRVERILDHHLIPFEEVTTEAAVKAALAEQRPVIFMIATEGPKVLGVTLPMGHWVVAYGYDDRQIFITNWPCAGMPWPEFLARWNSLAGRVISMRNVGLAAKGKTI